jgi:hypothetical protein
VADKSINKGREWLAKTLVAPSSNQPRPQTRLSEEAGFPFVCCASANEAEALRGPVEQVALLT